jgi:hypothetical protein
VIITPASSTIRVGDSESLVAYVRDSTWTTLTDPVTWVSADTSLVRVIAPGLVSGVAAGTGRIAATSGSVSATAIVTVYAPFVARMEITPSLDTLFTGEAFPLVAHGTDQMGQTYLRDVVWTSSDSAVATVDGKGVVFAVAPGTAIITARSGNATATSPVTVAPMPPVPLIDGDWTMTLSASPSCRDALPLVARERQYTVHFTQRGTKFGLTITSPTLEVANAGENSGGLFGTKIDFGFIGDTDYGSWSTTDLHDHLGDGTTLDFDGDVTGVVFGSTIKATMNGDLELGPPTQNGPLAICRATDHVITLQRK